MGGRGSAGRSRNQATPAPAASTPAPERIRDALDKLIPESGGLLMLSDLRAALPDLSRDEFDNALAELARDPHVSLVPESNQKVLTEAERDAAIVHGNQTKHLISIVKPVDPGARERIETGGVTAASDADLAMAQRDDATGSALYEQIRAEVRRRKATP